MGPPGPPCISVLGFKNYSVVDYNELRATMEKQLIQCFWVHILWDRVRVVMTNVTRQNYKQLTRTLAFIHISSFLTAVSALNNLLFNHQWYSDMITTPDFSFSLNRPNRLRFLLFTPISSHVINLLIKLLLISPTYFVPCKFVPWMQKVE